MTADWIYCRGVLPPGGVPLQFDQLKRRAFITLIGGAWKIPVRPPTPFAERYRRWLNGGPPHCNYNEGYINRDLSPATRIAKMVVCWPHPPRRGMAAVNSLVGHPHCRSAVRPVIRRLVT